MLDHARNASDVRMMMEETTRLFLVQEQQEICELELKRSELALAAREAEESYRACIHALEVREALIQKAVLTELDQVEAAEVPPSLNDLSPSDGQNVQNRWSKLHATHLPNGDKKLPDVVAFFSTVASLAKNLKVYNGDVDSIFFDDEPQELASSRRGPAAVTQEKPPPLNLKARTHKAKKDALKKVQMALMISQFEAQVEKEKPPQPVFMCTLCESICFEKESLEDHLTEQDSPPEKVDLKCTHEDCSFSCSSSLELQTHMMHCPNVEVFKCTECRFTSPTVHELRDHERTHIKAVKQKAPVEEEVFSCSQEGCPFQTTNPKSRFKHEQEQVQICPPATSSKKDKARTPPPVRPQTPNQPTTPRKEVPSPKNKTKPLRLMGAPAFGGSSCQKRGCTCGLPHYKPYVGEGNGGISRFFGMPLIAGHICLCIRSHLTLMRTSGTLRRTSVAFTTCAYEESDGSGFFGGAPAFSKISLYRCFE